MTWQSNFSSCCDVRPFTVPAWPPYGQRACTPTHAHGGRRKHAKGLACMRSAPWVPTGMNMGVSASKWGNVNLDALARPCLASTRKDRAGDTDPGSFSSCGAPWGGDMAADACRLHGLPGKASLCRCLLHTSKLCPFRCRQAIVRPALPTGQDSVFAVRGLVQLVTCGC